DGEAQRIMQAMAAHQPLPPQPEHFQKVVHMLEEAVRGFSIGAHGNFWDALNRDQFIAAPIFGPPIVKQNPDGTFDPVGSPLIHRLRGAGVRRMPRQRPPVPEPRIQYIHDWILAGCPDSDPPLQPGLRRERSPVLEPASQPPVVRPTDLKLLLL